MARMDALSSNDWVDAAWESFRASGISAIKVEALAKQLGASKGSFYWHFTNRRALVDAVLDRWQRVRTEQMIEIAETGGTPQERLVALFDAVSALPSRRTGEATLYVNAQSEGVQDVVRAVSERRIRYLADILVDLGFDRSEALRRSTIAIAVVIGLEQLTTGTGEVPEAAGEELTRTALQMILAR